MLRIALLLSLVASSAAFANSTQKSLTGTVVDERGAPVEGATVCGQWGPESGRPTCLLPFHALTDASGHFTLSPAPVWGSALALMVFDRDHKTGALVSAANAADLGTPVRVVLHPLVAVRYRLETPVPVNDSELSSHLLLSSVPVFALWGHQGTVLLPPGQYTLSSGIYDSDKAKMDFTVGASPLVLSPLKLNLSIMAQHYGRKAPPISSLVDMSRKPAEIRPRRGQWTLLYFWEDGCVPCIQTGLPNLIEFAASGQASAANLQIYAINTRFPGTPADWNQFHSHTTRLEATLWHAVPSFPMLYDESYRTSQDWGIRMYPTYGLIDPSGNLVRTEKFDDVKARLGATSSSATIRSAP